MAQVSVPCGGCGKAIRFGFQYCNGCGKTVSPELRAALEDRLDATSSEFRNMRNGLREASAILLVLGALRILLSIFLYASGQDTLDSAALSAARLSLALDVLIGTGTLVAAWFVERRPERIAVSALVAWVLVQFAILLVSPLTFVSGLVGRLILSVGLLRGVSAARRAEALRHQLVTAEH